MKRLRPALERAVRTWWAGEGGTAGALLDGLTRPLEGAYGWALARRNRAWADGTRSSEGPDAPVVSVGNLTVGGTGKTPVTAWLVASLAGGGHAVAVVARGYGEDELALHRRWNPGVPVVADPDRVAASRTAVERGAAVVVADDAFQHRRLRRDLDVVLLAAEQSLPARLLPRGPWREPPASLSRADTVVVTRKSASAAEADALAAWVAVEHPGVAVARLDLRPGPWQDLRGRPAPAPGGPVLAVCSIAGPEGFRALVEQRRGERVELLPFPDHYRYDVADAQRLARKAGVRTLVTTEKDAVKLLALEPHLPDVRVLPLVVEPLEGADALLERVLAVAAGGRR